MNLGTTGSRHGMTAAQKETVGKIVLALLPSRVHHGDCVGSDQQMHDLVRTLLPHVKIKVHPPLRTDKRAFCTGDEVAEPRDFLDRDDDIVNESDQLLATPRGVVEQIRSGTWATIRRARKAGKPVRIVSPDGTVRVEGE